MAASPEELRDRILSFVTGRKSRRPVLPVLKEAGVVLMPLAPGRFRVEAQRGKVVLEVWDESRSIVRRILEIRRQTPGELVLAYQRFGSGQGLVRLLASAKGAPELEREAMRSRFAARLRKLLAQTFPGWTLKQLTAERDLERSLSAQAARAVLSRGQPTGRWSAARRRRGKRPRPLRSPRGWPGWILCGSAGRGPSAWWLD